MERSRLFEPLGVAALPEPLRSAPAANLGAAGLLQGKRAATHWMSMDMLKAFGAIPVSERVVVDGNTITGGGVTAGIDFGLTVAAEVAGPEAAKAIQLGIEYDPQPPFDSGSVAKASAETKELVRLATASRPTTG